MAEHNDKAKLLITVDGSKTHIEIEGCAGGLAKAFKGLLQALEQDKQLQAFFSMVLDDATEETEEKIRNVEQADPEKAVEILEELLAIAKKATKKG